MAVVTKGYVAKVIAFARGTGVIKVFFTELSSTGWVIRLSRSVGPGMAAAPKMLQADHLFSSARGEYFGRFQPGLSHSSPTVFRPT